MKVLCLHGSFGSAKHFQVQLNPFISIVEKPGKVDFKWVDGANTATPPAGFENYFGNPPLYRHIDFDGIHGLENMVDKVRDLPEGMTAEDTMRALVGDEEEFYSVPAVNKAIRRLFELVDEDPEIDGILGYSEGATTAATMLLEERRLFETEGRPRRLKYAIFFAGWPPVSIEGDRVKCLLADECEDMIDVPTCHIVGCKDPYIDGAMALYAMCDEDTATLFDHGKGHTLPRDAQTVQELAAAIGSTFDKTGIST